jgi:hypothetical protein
MNSSLQPLQSLFDQAPGQALPLPTELLTLYGPLQEAQDLARICHSKDLPACSSSAMRNLWRPCTKRVARKFHCQHCCSRRCGQRFIKSNSFPCSRQQSHASL